ncbi:MAG TPA: cyclase family protein [Ilumatobacteraceae bacterium]|nr:cyclase family protein [Ilumatobacteraceae bacterium]
MARFVDLSHSIAEGLSTYPGLPAPHIFDHLDRAAAEKIYGPGVTFTIGMITICSNTGTYIDVPYHRFADGHDLTGLALERVAAVPGLCIDCRGIDSIGPEVLTGLDLTGRAVLFRTDHSRHFGTPSYFERHPHLAVATAETLVRAGVACAGIDSLNIDATEGPAGAGRPVHTTLLRSDIPIIEHLANLADLPPDGFRFSSVPPKIEGLGTFTVRAFAEVT